MAAGDLILRGIVSNLNDVIGQCGIMCHIFSRIKSRESIESKLRAKQAKYLASGTKMQDLLALRITFYFTDDVEVLHEYLKKQANFVDESVTQDEVDKFRPKCLNLIMRVPEIYKQDISVAINETGHGELIDDTYEIQLRTILSEGWHEVEHDLRYKCKEDWSDHFDESRLLNGIYASLESSEWSMLALFDRLSYSHYKNKCWNSMIRDKMRIRLKDKGLSSQVESFLSQNEQVARTIFRKSRSEVLGQMLDMGFSMPITYDTIVHLLNRFSCRNDELASLEDPVLSEELDCLFGKLI